MISYDDAIAMVRAEGAARRLEGRRVAVTAAVGRVLGADATARIDHPRFEGSSMDGLAVRAADLPGTLRVGERIAAGRAEPVPPVVPGTCHAIMTGAKLPEGADAVVPIEKVVMQPDGRARIDGAVGVGDFIRRAGSDYRAGDLVLAAGTEVTADHLLALTTLGITELEVARPPRITLFTTGAEVVASGELGPTEIYDATGPFLEAQLNGGGCVVERRRVGDDPEAFRSMVERASADVVISTGAVSMGDHDFVPDVLRSLRAEVLFHRVAIRPGKPILLARLPSGTPFVGLPGNPASSAVGFRFFLRPLLDAMRGRPPERSRPAVLTHAYRKGDVPLRCFVRARERTGPDGVRRVEILPEQASFRVRPYAESDGWVIVDSNANELPEASTVQTFPA